MRRFKSERGAKMAADADGLRCGLCVVDGLFYVGTAEQLERIGCVVYADNDWDKCNIPVS